jgi:uncharacterized protein (DUF2336 family)
VIVERFLNWSVTADADDRARAVGALARCYLEGRLSLKQSEIAELALTVVLDDPDTSVRYALSTAMARHHLAPRHLVLALACDNAEVAFPVIAGSPLLVDAELIEFAATGGGAAQAAIACRERISPALAEFLSENGDTGICMALLMNSGARISVAALHRIAERHGSDGEIRELLEARAELRPESRLLLLDYSADALRACYAVEQDLNQRNIDQRVREFVEISALELAASLAESELSELIDGLIKRQRMTTAFLLRAVCTGSLAMFSCAIGRLANAPVWRVEAILQADRRRSAFRALYLKAGLPESAFSLFANAVDSWRQRQRTQSTGDPVQIAHLVTRELVENYCGNSDARLDNLLALLRKLDMMTARDNARIAVSRFRNSREGPEAARPALAPEPAAALPSTDLSLEVIAHFALHFADELIEMEAEAGTAEPASPPPEFAPGQESLMHQPEAPDAAANDDRPAARSLNLSLLSNAGFGRHPGRAA